MSKIMSRIILYAGSVMLALAGCGGGGTTTPAVSASAGVSKGTVAKSVSSATGQQITVNNVTFSTANATVTLNGDAAAPQDLKPGMQVTITGSINGTSGTASHVEIEGELEGMVELVDAAAGRFVLLGQTVVVSDLTVFEGSVGITGLTAGRMVEVHGMSDAQGVVAATRVEVKPMTKAPYISGPISNLDPERKMFSIRTITVDYASATLPVQPLANGLVVKARGTYANGNLTAQSIRVRHVHPDHGHAEFEGLVSGYDPVAGTFLLNGQPVQLAATTAYSHGAVGDIADGIKVEVKGEVVNGILVASKVEIDREHSLPAPGPVTPPVTGTVNMTLSALPPATVGTAYNQALTATGGTPPYTWSIAAGTLPGGLVLTSTGSTWAITGTPSVTGSFNVMITVSDSATPAGSVTRTLPLTVAASAPAPLPGKALYDASCSGCHRLGTYDASGSAPNLSGKAGLVAGKIGGGHMGIALGSQQLADLASFVATY